MANRFLNNITINDEYTLPSADGTADQIITTDGSGQLSFVDQNTINAGNAEHVVIYAKNTHTASIAKGTPVYITGTVGATDTVEIAPADAGNSAKMPAVGLLDATLAVNAFGYVITGGFMDNITTDPIDGATPTSNDTVYVKVGGGLTLTKPTGPTGLIQNVAKVGKVSGGNSGSLIVSSILRTNDVPNLTTGKIWVGDGNTVESTVVHLDETNGRMGIGTASPLAKTHIKASNAGGDSAASGTLIVEQGSAPSIQLLSANSQTQTIKFADPQSSQIGRISYSHPSDAMFFVTNGTERMRITSAGNIGIGTTSPSAKLQVSSTSGWGVFTERGIKDGSTSTYSHNYSAGNAHILGRAVYFENSAVFSTSTADATTKEYRFSNASDKLTVKSLVAGNTFDDNILVLSGSNVGIGTASPARTLDVAGRGRFVDSTGTVDICSSTYVPLLITNTNGYAHARINGFEVGGNTTANNEGYIKTSDNSRKLILDTNGWRFLAQNAEFMRIASSGNVGIGTTSPSKKLHVVGSQRIDQSADWDGLNIYGFDNQSSDYLQLHIGTTPMARYRSNLTHSFYVNTSRNLDIAETAIAFRVNTSYSDDLISIFGNNKDSYIGYSNTDNRLKIGFGSLSGPTVDSNTKLSLDASGVYVTDNLGIGTTSPSEKLEVAGNIVINGSSDSADGLHLKDRTFVAFSDAGSVVSRFRSSASGVFQFQDGSYNTNVVLNNNGNSYFNGGNVGIGTTSPSTSLHVKSTSAGSGYMTIENTVHYSKLDLKSTTYTGSIVMDGTGSYASGGGLILNSGTNIRTQFLQGGVNKMIINNGNVGIGTTNPNSILHITDANPEFILEDTTNPNRSKIKNNDGCLRYEADYNSQMGNSKHQFFIDGSEKFRINTDGNVGIGTTAPSEKLHVEGDIRLLDELIFGEYSTTTDRITNQSYALTIAHSDSINFKVGAASVFNVYGTQIRPQVNDTVDLGHSSFRWKRGFFDDNILTNGNIGIGTDYPSDELTIEAETPTIRLKDISSSNYAEFYVNNFDTYLDCAGRTFIRNGGSTNVTVTSTGNVGIGTTTPSTPLHINADAPTLRLQDATSGDNHYLTGNNGELRVQSSGFITMRPGAAVSTTFLANGNVGIGTTNPSEELHVVGRAIVEDRLAIGGDFVPQKALHLKNAAPVLRLEDSDITGGYLDMIKTSRNMKFDLEPTDAVASTNFDFKIGGITHLYMKNSQVGVMNSSPTEALDVTGNVQAETLIATDLNDGFVPYSKSGTLGLQDSKIYTNGAHIGVGTTTLAAGCHITSLSDISAAGYRVSAMQTAPSSRGDTGTLGEIRITADYIYVCYATDSWRRVALSSW